MARDKKLRLNKGIARALHKWNKERFTEFKPVKPLCPDCGEKVSEDKPRCVKCETAVQRG